MYANVAERAYLVDTKHYVMNAKENLIDKIQIWERENMNKFQKLMVSVVKTDLKLNKVEELPEYSFRCEMLGWRQAVRYCKNNYAAIKGKRDQLKEWLERSSK